MKSFFVIFCSILLLFAVVSCLDEAYVQKVVIEVGPTQVAVGSTLSLNTKITPNNATDKTLTWTSSDEEIATVKDGTVTGVKVGEVTITATSVADPQKKDEVKINVVEPTGILEVSAGYDMEPLGNWSIEIKIGDEIIGTLDKDTLSISKALVVDEYDGFKKAYDLTLIQTGLENYEVKVSATNVEIQKDKTSKVVVNIHTRPVETVKVQFQEGSASSICVEDTSQLIATVSPDNASVKDVEWTSSDNNVATVDGNGRVTGVGKGTATIRAASISNPEVYDEVSIDVDYQRGNLVIQEDHGNLDLPDDWSITLKVGDFPSEILNGSKSKVTMNNLPVGKYAVSVTNEGLGRYRVTTNIPNGVSINRDTTTTVEIKIEAVPVESISLASSTGSSSLDVGQKITLTATVTPDYATVQNVTWESSDKKVATVDGNGVVTGVSKGKATITATSVSNPEKTASFDVDVVIPMGTLSVRTNYDGTPSLPEVWSIDVKADDVVIGTLNENAEPISKVIPVDDYVITVDSTGLDDYEVSVSPSHVGIQKGKTSEVVVNISPIPVQSISLESSTATDSLVVGDSLTLKAVMDPVHATDKRVTWKSSNTDIATVDDKGVVTGVSAGQDGQAVQVTITATSVSDTTKKAERTLYVDWQRGSISATANLGSLKLPSDWSIDVLATRDGKTTEIGTLNASTTTAKKESLPKGTYELTLNRIRNLDNYIVEIAQKTTVVERDETANATVNIMRRPVESIEITGSGSAYLTIGDTLQLAADVLPYNATDKSVSWTSDKKLVATVDENGLVTAVGQGMAIITATSKSDSNVSSSFPIGVRVPTGTLKVTADYEGLTLPDGWSIKVKVDDNVLGTLSAADKDISGTFDWGDHKLQMDSVSGLDKYDVGFVVDSTPVEEPSVKIEKNTTTSVTVKINIIPVQQILLSLPKGSSGTICETDKLQLAATVTPSNATDKTLTWSSNNDKVATVNGSGNVTGVGEGTAIITATWGSVRSNEIHITVKKQTGNLQVNVDYGKLELPDDWIITVKDGEEILGTLSESNKPLEVKDLVVGEHSITFKPTGLDNYEIAFDQYHATGVIKINRGTKIGITIVISERPVTSISLKPITTDPLIVGDTLTLEAEVLPKNATDKRVTWESSNKDVATVDKNGVVTGVGAGEVSITATSVSNPKLKDSKTINVDWQRGTLSAKATYDSSLPLPSSWSIDVYGKRGSETTQIGTLKAGTLSIKKEALRTGDYELTLKQNGLDNFIVDVEPKTAAVERGKETPVTVTISKRSVEKITLSPSREGSLNLGDTLTLTPAITPKNATEQVVAWSSGNESVAKVDSNGIVTTQGTPGTAVITAELDGKSATYKVTVDDEITVYGRAQLLPANFIEKGTTVIASDGITVTIEGTDLETTTKSGGYFNFSDVPRGKVTFVFTKGDISYGCDTFDYSKATTGQRPDGIMLIPITAHKSAIGDVPYGVTGYGSYSNGSLSWSGDWRVLDRVDNKALLISSKVIEDHIYSYEASSWKDSDLKSYLNGDFYSKRFTDTEKKYIVDEGYGKVFVLSVDEVNKYFANNEIDRSGTDLQGSNYQGWWLRSDTVPTYSSFVSNAGAVHSEDKQIPFNETYGVRPVIWVQLGK